MRWYASLRDRLAELDDSSYIVTVRPRLPAGNETEFETPFSQIGNSLAAIGGAGRSVGLINRQIWLRLFLTCP